MNGSSCGLVHGTEGTQMSMEQQELEQIVAFTEANQGSTFDASRKLPNTNDFIKRINIDKQGKHIKQHKNFEFGKSEIIISIDELNELVGKYAGKGEFLNANKERVDFMKIIGIYKDVRKAENLLTTIGIIHYSKTGIHIVPARPKEESGFENQ